MAPAGTSQSLNHKDTIASRRLLCKCLCVCMIYKERFFVFPHYSVYMSVIEFTAGLCTLLNSDPFFVIL